VLKQLVDAEIARRMEEEHQEPLFLFTKTWRGLSAAARLGDRAAARILERMNHDLAVFGVILTLVAGCVFGGHLGLEACRASAQAEVETVRIRETNAAELRLKQAEQSAALRSTYIKECRVTPDQAETLFPYPTVEAAGVGVPEAR
jgi:hypothetical protein